MAGIKELLGGVDAGESDDYKRGWRECVCWLNDRYQMTSRRDGEPVQIVITLSVDEDELVARIEEMVKNEKQDT